MNKEQELKKEIEDLEIKREKYDNRGLFNLDRDMVDSQLNPLKAELKGYQSAKAQTIKEVEKIIDKNMFCYRKNKLSKPNNFTIEDRATAMVVLDDLKQRIKKLGEEN